MILSFHPCFDADVQIVIGSRRLSTQDLGLIQRAEAIILPQACPLELYEACSESHARLFPNYDVQFNYPGKIGQSLLFEKLEFPHPETLRWLTVEDFRNAHPKGNDFPHKLPFLLKDDKSHEAEGVFFVADRASLLAALDFLDQRERSGMAGFVSQAYIPSNGDVLRVVIIGNKMIAYWKRPTAPGQVITTVRKGAVIDHNWRPDLQEKAKAQAQKLRDETGINLAALDIVFTFSEKTNDPVFLEINYYFGRRGLGGSENYYRILYQEIRHWLKEAGADSNAVRFI